MKILMVCLGNICRSPIAEGVLQHKANLSGLQWKVDSAGTNGYHTGEPPHLLSQKIAKANGIDISNQESRPFVKEDFKKYDIIYAMAADIISEMRRIGAEHFDEEKVVLFLNELYPGLNKNVPDPWYSNSDDAYEEVYELIDRTCDMIVKKHKDSNITMQ